jgi:hypothetical protein
MSIKIMARVWENGPADKSEVLVLLAIADYCNDDGECWPAVASIAGKARMTERGVQKICARLIDIGWLEIDIRMGRRGCNLYRIKTPNTVHPEHGSPRTRLQETPNTVPKNPEPRSPEPSLTIIKPSEEPPLSPPAEKPAKRRPEIPLPEGWVPSERNIRDAEDRQFSAKEIDHEADRFRNHHHAKGSRYRDWDAAWRTWLGNARKYAGNRGMAGGQSPGGYGRGGSIASIVARRRAEGSV